MLSIDIVKLPGHKALIYIFTIVSLIIPGIGYIYLTDNNLFSNLETTKLILLSIFYSFPLYLLGVIAGIASVSVLSQKNRDTEKNGDAEKNRDTGLKVMWISSIISLFSFYGAIIFSLASFIFLNITLNNSLLCFMYFFGLILGLYIPIMSVFEAKLLKKRKAS